MDAHARARFRSIQTAAKCEEIAGRVLAVDYGRKKIGLALSDALQLTASPLTTLVRRNRESDLRFLRDVCREKGVRLIVVGHPLHIDGEISEMAEECARFARRLKKNLGIPVELVDERLTTWEARQQASGDRPSRRARPVDELAAAVLLREYLEGAREKSTQTLPAEVR